METKKIRMKKTAYGSNNGINISKFDANEEYEVTVSLAQNFVEQQKIAEYVIESKARQSAPENKMMSLEENKALEDEEELVVKKTFGTSVGKRGK